MTDKKEMLSQKQSDTKAQTSAAAAAAAPAEVQMCVKCVQSIYIECTTCKTWLDYQKYFFCIFISLVRRLLLKLFFLFVPRE